MIAAISLEETVHNIEDKMTAAVVLRQRLFAGALASSLLTGTGLNVVGVGCDGNDAIFLSRVHRPRVLVLDANLSGPPRALVMDSIALYAPATRILEISSDPAPASRSSLSKQVWDVRGYQEELDELVLAVESVAKSSKRSSIHVSTGPQPLHVRSSVLTGRETEVLTQLAEGLTNIEIGVALHISAGTVKRHLANIYSKLGVNSRVEALRQASALGVVRL
ncbi:MULTISPECIES: response regulator transcription factor [unclassified Rathayibacter]|uniref:response regulator transcription factor n=1 Tax=unclassified Rathayibacter TaxID=2609250 RepID=UPI00188CB338|nr:MULTISPECIES: response regulator transcription factor [unclassified Rathayibacter]MBF4462668.1 response regulator transcription factor [Rathayibacter sp. VKM Ac-2879]MBF4504082.1 response regulator transcription factor [Rathayibacter sp. VKM Ac-2878]